MARFPSRLALTLFVPVALALACVGCGSQHAQPTGRVVEGAAPVPRAELLFESTVDGRTTAISGLTGPDGVYQLDYGAHAGLPPGPVRVTITRVTARGAGYVPEGEEAAAALQRGRARREAFVFEEDLPAGKFELDFDLSEGQPVRPQ